MEPLKKDHFFLWDGDAVMVVVTVEVGWELEAGAQAVGVKSVKEEIDVRPVAGAVRVGEGSVEVEERSEVLAEAVEEGRRGGTYSEVSG